MTGPNDLGYFTFARETEWHPASGHPSGRWRVVKGVAPMRELEGRSGRLILFKDYWSAQRRAITLNKAEAGAAS